MVGARRSTSEVHIPGPQAHEKLRPDHRTSDASPPPTPYHSTLLKAVYYSSFYPVHIRLSTKKLTRHIKGKKHKETAQASEQESDMAGIVRPGVWKNYD